MSTHASHGLEKYAKHSRSRFRVSSILVLVFVLGLAIYAPRSAHALGSTTCSSSADFDVSADPYTIPLAAGATGSSTLTFTPLNGFTGPITLTLANVDSNLTPSLSANILDLTSGPKTATVTVTAHNTVTAGNYYLLDVNATATATLFHDTTISVHVPSPELGISAQTSFLTIAQGSATTDTINLLALHGLMDSSVTVSAVVQSPPPSSTPPMVLVNPSATLTSGVGTSILTVSTSSTTSLGYYIVKVTGTTSSATNSTSVFVGVTGPNFAVSAKPTTLEIPVGLSGTSTINVTSLEGFYGTVALTAVVYPVSISLSPIFTPASVTLTSGSHATSDLTIAVSNAAAAGSYAVLVTGKSGSVTNFTSIEVKVPGPGYSLTANPSVLRVSQGGSAKTSTISLGSINGFAGTVNLSISCFPDGLIASLTPASVTVSASIGGSATLSVSAYSFALPGSYSVRIDGVGATSSAFNDTTVDVQVTGPGFSLSATPFIASFATGGSTTSMITATSILGFSGTINLAASVFSYPNPGTGLTATLSPSSLTLPSTQTSTLTLSASAPGTYIVTITGTSWPLTNDTGVLVDVTPNTPDFTITASPPSSVPADGNTAATSTITVNPLNGFGGTVALSHAPLPSDLNCQAFSPPAVTSSGQSSLSCTSTVAGTYPVIITGSTGTLTHPTIAMFTFTSTTSPDFAVTASPQVSFTAGSTATSTVTGAALHGFYSQVSLTTSVSPNSGLSVSLDHQSFLYGSGTSTATFSSTTPGIYTVTITGTYGSLVHTATVQVTVTSATTPDVTVTPSVSSLSFNSGTSGTATITIAQKNGFTGTVSLSTSQSTPAGLTCTLPASVTFGTSPQTVALTCNSSSAGDYTITITTRAGANTHTTTVPVHVAAVSPAAPAPSPILGLDPTVFYAIIAGIIVVVVAGTVIAIRQRGSKSQA